jgi:hypothetical protein
MFDLAAAAAPTRRDHNSNQPNVWQEDHTGSPDVDDFVVAGQTDGWTRVLLMSTAWSERVDPVRTTNTPSIGGQSKADRPNENSVASPNVGNQQLTWKDRCKDSAATMEDSYEEE